MLGRADEVTGCVAGAFDDHLAEQATWPVETDVDRLDATFAALLRQGVLVLQDAGTTQDDGLADAAQADVEAGGEQAGIVGYCFYTGQDLDRAVELGKLTLSFGDGDERAGVAVGHRVRSALEAYGFSVRRDGSLGQRIDVGGLDWRGRRQRPALPAQPDGAALRPSGGGAISRASSVPIGGRLRPCR